MAQGGWLIAHAPLNSLERGFIARQDGLSARQDADPALPSRLTERMASLALWTPPRATSTPETAARFPFLLFGTLLGASLWYVARRLYGNAGGYIALALYAFSPVMLTYSARVEPDIAAAWAVFGCIFTGIAVAHTLYAPREVVLWNWRRILLLGLATGLGAAAQFSAAVAVPIALAFMLYVVPQRRPAALLIMAAACVVGSVILGTIYSFDLPSLARGISASGVFGLAPRFAGLPATGGMLARFFLHNSAAFAVFFVAALAVYAAWPRTRFFGTTAPLLTAAILVCLAVTLPHAAGFSFLIIALPFLFVFIAGVFADLLETRHSAWVLGAVLALLLAHAYYSISGLLLLPS